jgi:L-amino acid N-acyltransferase YncA
MRPPSWTIGFGHLAIARPTAGVENATVGKETTVRGATAGDAEAICAIFNAAIVERRSTFETTLRSAADLEARIDDARLPLLVGASEERVLGWAGLTPYSSRECYAGIGEASVYVDDGARGRGTGTALTEALAGAAQERGCRVNPSRKSHDAGAQPRPGRAEAAVGVWIRRGPARDEVRFLKRPEIGAHRLARGLCDSRVSRTLRRLLCRRHLS